MFGTGIDVVPNFRKCPVPVIPTVSTADTPTKVVVTACSTKKEGNSTTSQWRRQTDVKVARVSKVAIAGYQLGAGPLRAFSR